MTLLRVLFAIFLLQTINSVAETALDKVTLQLQWKYQFQFAGFIMAKELGYYKDAGLEVEILEYRNTNSIQDLVGGKIDYAIINSIVSYHDKQLYDVSLLASYFQRSPLVFITQPKIRSPNDLIGKRVILSENNHYNSSLSILLEYYNITADNTTFISPTFNLDDFIDKKVDAVAAFVSNEVFELNTRNIPYNIIDPVDHGFATNAINLFATHDKINNNPQQVKAFLNASKRGWQYALDHIDEVAHLIHDKYQPNKSFELLQYEGKITRQLMLTSLYDIGEINKDFVVRTYSQLLRRGRLNAEQQPDHLFFIGSSGVSNDLQPIKLSNKEIQWLKTHPVISYTGNPDWLPFEAYDQKGNHIGIVADYLKLVENGLTIQFNKIVENNWADALGTAIQGDVSVISGDMVDPLLGQKFKPIDSFISNPIVIVMQHSMGYVDQLSEIADKKIAIIKDYGYTADLFARYPNIKFIEVETSQDALLGIATDRYDAALVSLALASYSITDMGMEGLTIVGKTDVVMNLTLFVKKDEPVLHGILNKAMHHLSPRMQQSILKKWRHNKNINSIDYTLMWKLSFIVIIVLLFLLYRHRVLTKHHKKTEKLKERMELALMGNSDALWDWNMLDNSAYISPRWKQMLGYEDDEIINHFSSWESRTHPDDLPAVYQEIKCCVEKGKSSIEIVHRLKHRNGQWLWILGRAKIEYNESNEAVRMIGTHTDITEEKEMHLQYAHQAQIIEQTHDSIISTDLNGIIASWNAGSEQLIGYKAEEMIGQHISRVYPKEDYAQFDGTIALLKDMGEYNAVVRIIKKSGDILFADLSLSLLKDEKGNPVGMVCYSQDITERKTAEDKLEAKTRELQRQAHYDGLTGLPNRELFLDRLSQSIKSAQRCLNKAAVLFIDLDHFKEINDSLGHHIGDEVLMQVASRLKRHVRQVDTIARLGGDEFTVILNTLEDGNVIINIVNKLLDAMALPVVVDSHQLYVTLSIGVTIYPDDGEDADVLLKNADAAMYKAKEDGRNTYCFYAEEMTEKAFERIRMETSLRQALKNEELVLYYQPQINGINGDLVGMEALVRWNHPEQGMVSPAKFIPLAEKTSLILEIDCYVIKTAIQQISAWLKQDIDPVKVSINISVKQLLQENFFQTLQQLLIGFNCKPEYIELEVTEGHVMKNPQAAVDILQKISELGVALAVDDFGTGYSSLAYLKRLPIDKLKIDQSFIRGLPDDDDDAAIVKAVIALSDGLDLSVLAEGVETAEQRDFLVKNGCPNIQGFYYAKPMDAKAMATFVQCTTAHVAISG